MDDIEHDDNVIEHCQSENPETTSHQLSTLLIKLFPIPLFDFVFQITFLIFCVAPLFGWLVMLIGACFYGFGAGSYMSYLVSTVFHL